MKLAEVARIAGVSPATVSRVLSGQAPVAVPTRERVLSVIRDLRFQPNLHAQALAGGRTRTLGMIVSNIENPFFLGVFCSLEDLGNRQGYEVVVENTGYHPDRLVEAMRSMLKRRVVGLAVIVSEMDRSLIDELAGLRTPIVFYDVGRPERNITNIRINYQQGMLRTAQYLYSLGHRRFGFVGHHAGLGPLQERKRTFIEVMRGFGSAVRWGAAAGSDSPEGGRLAAGELLASTLRPTAILCVNDWMATGVLRQLRDRDLRVPEDVSVAGFDNIALAEHLCPSLTTARIPQRQIGELAFEALVFDSPDRPRDIVIDPDLIVRESTGPSPLQKRKR